MTMLTAPTPDRVLTDYPAEDDRWQWNRVQRTLENEALYRGDFTPLLNGRVKSARNGLLQVLADSDYIFSNWFRRITEFNVDAIISERPGISSTNVAREAWIEDAIPAVWRRYGRALRLRSTGGYFAIQATTAGRLRAIPSHNVFPVVDEFDPELVLGWALAYDYYDDPDTRTGRHLRVVEIGRDDVETPPVFTYAYDGYSIGALQDSATSDVAGFWVWGDGESDYTPAVASLCAEGMVMQTLLAQGLHQHLLPALQGPAAWIQSLMAQGDTNRERRTASGLVIPVDINDAPAEFFSAEVNAQDALAYLVHIADELHRETGISPIVFGIGGQGGSAVSFDRLLFKSMARVRVHRREIEGPTPEILDVLGAPPGDTSTTWPADPFASVAERAAMVRSDLESGIIDVNEARVARGYAPVEEEPARETPAIEDEA